MSIRNINSDGTILEVGNSTLTLNLPSINQQSCRAGGHNAYLSRLGVPYDRGMQPH
jgi:hypothetical protein